MINISSNFNKQKKYIFDGIEIIFGRIYCGVSGTSAVIIGEEKYHGVTNYYLLADVVCKTFNDLIKVLSSIRRFRVNEFFWKYDRERNEILTRHHIAAFRARKPQLFFTGVPDDSLTIASEIEAIMSCLSPKHLYLFNESRLPAALQALPTDYSRLRAVDYPLVAALGYALTMMLDIPQQDEESAELSLTARRYGK